MLRQQALQPGEQVVPSVAGWPTGASKSRSARRPRAAASARWCRFGHAVDRLHQHQVQAAGLEAHRLAGRHGTFPGDACARRRRPSPCRAFRSSRTAGFRRRRRPALGAGVVDASGNRRSCAPSAAPAYPGLADLRPPAARRGRLGCCGGSPRSGAQVRRRPGAQPQASAASKRRIEFHRVSSLMMRRRSVAMPRPCAA
jgi:hypothetical protein